MITKNKLIYGGATFAASLFISPYEVNAQFLIIAFIMGGLLLPEIVDLVVGGSNE